MTSSPPLIQHNLHRTRATVRHSTHKHSKDLLIELEEDLEVALAFCSALKRKLDCIYTAAFPNADERATRGELTRKLDMIGTLAKKGVKLQKVSEYRFVRVEDDP